MIPYDIFRLASANHALTEEEQSEYALLEAHLSNASIGPAADFPWQRWKELCEKRQLSTLPEERPSQRFFRLIKAAQQEVSEEEERLRLWPITNANIAAQNLFMNEIELKQRRIAKELDVLDRMIRNENELFGPAVPAPSLSKSAALSLKTHQLLGICIGGTEAIRRSQTELFDRMFEGAKKALGYNNKTYSTACVAVYKLARWLNLVEQDTKSSKWVPLLETQYGVSVTEGQAKYSFDKPQKRLFITAVNAAYAVYINQYPHKTKSTRLPSGY